MGIPEAWLDRSREKVKGTGIRGVWCSGSLLRTVARGVLI